MLPDVLRKVNIRTRDIYYDITRATVIGHGILSEPLEAMFRALASVILYKSLHASAFQVTVFTMLKPAVALLAFYWGATLNSRKDRLIQNVTLAGFLSRAPFLFFPWINNAWVMIACFAIYVLFQRAEIPAWVEILKLNLPNLQRGKIYSLALSLAYIEGILLGLGFGPMMDYNEMSWRWIFPIAAGVGLCAVAWQARIPIDMGLMPIIRKERKKSLKSRIVDPWKNAFYLMRERKDFARFLMGFMMGGSGIMLLAPILPFFYVDTLNLSYTEIAIAILVSKGIGFIGSSSLWGRLLHQIHIYHFISLVCFFFALHPLMHIFAINGGIIWIYLSYFIYGIAQAGSRLSWNLSAPIFSKDKDSSAFSSVSVLMIGVRGCIVPLIGALIGIFIGPVAVLGLSVGLCLIASYKMRQWKKRNIYLEV